MEITSGRTVCQQRLAATCKAPSVEAKATVDGRRSVLRMSQYERRRWGNARSGGVDTAPKEVTPPTGKGALGKWRARDRKHQLDTEPDRVMTTYIRVEPEVQPGNQGAYASERLSLGMSGKVLRGQPLLPTGLGKSDRPG